MSRYEWVDSMLRDWVARCEDVELLRKWGDTIRLRADELEKRLELPLHELCAALGKAKHGDALYPVKRIRIPWDGPLESLRSVVYLASFDADTRTVWIAASVNHDGIADEKRHLNAAEISFYQLATKRLHVQRQERLRNLKSTEETEP